MPILKVTLTCGFSDAQKLDLMQQLTAAVQKALQAPADSIRIILNEIPSAHWWHAATPSQGASSYPLKSTENQ